MTKRKLDYFNHHFPLSKLVSNLTSHLTNILVKCEDDYLNHTMHNILYDITKELNLAYFSDDKFHHLTRAESYLHQLSSLTFILYESKLIYGNNYKHYCFIKMNIDEEIQKWKSYINR